MTYGHRVSFALAFPSPVVVACLGGAGTFLGFVVAFSVKAVAYSEVGAAFVEVPAVGEDGVAVAVEAAFPA